jgi:hypothetical protein
MSKPGQWPEHGAGLPLPTQGLPRRYLCNHPLVDNGGMESEPGFIDLADHAAAVVYPIIAQAREVRLEAQAVRAEAQRLRANTRRAKAHWINESV